MVASPLSQVIIVMQMATATGTSRPLPSVAPCRATADAFRRVGHGSQVVSRRFLVCCTLAMTRVKAVRQRHRCWPGFIGRARCRSIDGWCVREGRPGGLGCRRPVLSVDRDFAHFILSCPCLPSRPLPPGRPVTGGPSRRGLGIYASKCPYPPRAAMDTDATIRELAPEGHEVLPDLAVQPSRATHRRRCPRTAGLPAWENLPTSPRRLLSESTWSSTRSTGAHARHTAVRSWDYVRWFRARSGWVAKARTP